MFRTQLASANFYSIQQALDRLRQSVTLGGATSVFVYRPGGVTQGNVFATWPALVAAAQAVAGIKWVYFDDSLAPTTIPAGTWDFQGYAMFDGRPPGRNVAKCQCLFQDGARLIDVYEFQALDVVSESSSNVILASDHSSSLPEPTVFRVGNGTTMTVTGTAALFRHDGGAQTVAWWFSQDARLVTSSVPNQEVLVATARSSRLKAIATDLAVVEDFTMRHYPNTSLEGIVANAGAFVGDKQYPNINVTLAELAARVSYDDALAPQLGVTTAQEAFDKLKAISGGFDGSQLLSGTGAPNGSVLGNIGDLYVDRNGGPGTTFYVKEANSGMNIGWSPK